MALSPTYTLTVDLVGIDGHGVPGVAVEVELLDARLIFPLGAPPNQETLFPVRQGASTDASGVVTFELLPSSVTGRYRATIGAFSREFSMPAHDARLSTL
ncbi:MAG: hypothetical protein OXK82_02070 [Deltaproteobacteria bacterium]|nr:hypothetical protein [Deltaproteobacteria bacterium]